MFCFIKIFGNAASQVRGMEIGNPYLIRHSAVLPVWAPNVHVVHNIQIFKEATVRIRLTKVLNSSWTWKKNFCDICVKLLVIKSRSTWLVQVIFFLFDDPSPFWKLIIQK